MDELVSIIIPVYNVEKYLHQCIDTVLNQTYRNIEIILVDDGSTDNCPQICDEYKELDSRIRVIHKKNGGLSDARNAGLNIAKGKYVCFFDSDDVVSYRIIEDLYRACAKNNSDMAVCYYQKFRERYQDKANTKSNYEVITGQDVIKAIYKGQGEKIAFVAWNKIYKRDLFDKYKIRYPFRKQHEDIYTTYKLLYYSKRVSVVAKELYFYRVRSGSIMNSTFSEKRLDAIEARLEVIEFYGNHDEVQLQKMAVNDYFGSAIKIYQDAKKADNKKKRRIIKRHIFNDYKNVWTKYNCLTCGTKRILYGSFNLMPDLISSMYCSLKR